MKRVTLILFLLNSNLQNTIKILCKAFDYSILKNMAFVFNFYRKYNDQYSF